jgi:hypothetical protein
MIARVASTIAVLLVAAIAFVGYGPAPSGVNAPGVALCIGAVIVWFGWPAGYTYRRESGRRDGKRPDLVTIGAAPLLKEQSGDRDADEPLA